MEFTELSRIIIELFKNMSNQGVPPTVANLTDRLAAVPKLRSLLRPSLEEKPSQDFETYQLELNKLYKIKDELAQQMHAQEEEASARNDFLQRSLLSIIRLARKKDQSDLDSALESFQKTLANGADLDTLEGAMQTLKNEIIKLSLSQVSQPSDQSSAQLHPAHLPGQDKTPCLNKLKMTYLDILSVLEIDVGNGFLDTISSLRQKIDTETDIETLLLFRSEIETLVQTFAQQFFNARNKAASFITEVAHGLSELEPYLLTSVTNIEQDHKANTAFNTKMEKIISQTATSVRDIKQLEKLKNLVLARLSAIGEAIKNKKSHDQSRQKAAAQNLGSFRNKFDEIQDEVARVKNENRELLQKLRFDALTGALNRFAYEENLSTELKRYQRYKRTFSLIIFDIDNFKRINDGFGHLAGDKCLQETVIIIKSVLRENDILARFGGDEFAILLPESNREQAREVAEKIRNSIETTDFLFRNTAIPITISLGITEVLETDLDYESLINRSDQALYLAKRAGRNRVAVL